MLVADGVFGGFVRDSVGLILGCFDMLFGFCCCWCDLGDNEL